MAAKAECWSGGGGGDRRSEHNPLRSPNKILLRTSGQAGHPGTISAAGGAAG